MDIGGATANSFVIIHGERRTMCGDTRDVRAANQARNENEDLLWFTVDGQDWVVRDAATIAQALGLFRPQQEIDRRMDELGATQEELGHQQELLGEEEVKLSEAQERVADASSGKAAQDADASLNEMSQRLEAISRQMEELDHRMRELDTAQESLDDQATARAAQTQAGISNLLRDAMASGVARRLL